MEPNKPQNNLPSGGVGYVVIPEELDRDEYIKDCYRNCKISMNGGYGHGIYRDVPVPPNVMQEIIFPKEKEYGSSLIWIKDSTSSLPVIVNILSEEDDYFSLKENFKRKTVQIGDSVIDIVMDANTSSLQINITDDGNNDSECIIKLTGKNKKSVYKVISDNEIDLIAQNSINLKTKNDFNVTFTNDENKIKGSVNFNVENGLSIVSSKNISAKVNDSDDNELISISFDESGFIYKDVNKNEIIVDKNNIKAKAKEINLGDGKSPIPLGDKLTSLLGDMCDAISSIIVPTPAGPSGTPLNAAQFTVIKGKLDSILSKLSNTD